MVSARCDFVRHSHGFIPTKNTFARVNHNNGVERTILTLSTGGNEQDVKAMLELYGDLIETPEPQPDQVTALKGFQSDQKINQEITCDTQTDQKTDQKTKILTLIKSNSKITRLEIGKTIGLYDSSVKKRLESLISKGFIWRVGLTKGGHWEILNFN